jgi:hypothetical protein
LGKINSRRKVTKDFQVPAFHINAFRIFWFTKHGMIPWSSDVKARTWGGLSDRQRLLCKWEYRFAGYMHSDLGGFAGNNLDDQLYARWLQYGVFNPIFRPHAQEEACI